MQARVLIDVFIDRDRTFDDFNSLMALLNDSFAYMHNRIDPPSSLNRLTVQTLREKAQSETLVLAVAGNKPVGCLFARNKGSQLYVGKLAVDSHYRGANLARRLLDAAEVIAGDEQVGIVELETRVELVENHRFFEHLGFKKTAENAHDGYDQPTSYTFQKTIS